MKLSPVFSVIAILLASVLTFAALIHFSQEPEKRSKIRIQDISEKVEVVKRSLF